MLEHHTLKILCGQIDQFARAKRTKIWDHKGYNCSSTILWKFYNVAKLANFAIFRKKLFSRKYIYGNHTVYLIFKFLKKAVGSLRLRRINFNFWIDYSISSGLYTHCTYTALLEKYQCTRRTVYWKILATIIKQFHIRLR